MSNKKFLVPIEFPDGTVQSTAYTGSANSAVNVGSSAPLSPSNGDLFYNTTTDEFYLYISSMGWRQIAFISDLQNSLSPLEVSGGDANTVLFEYVYNGGNAYTTEFYPNLDGGILTYENVIDGGGA